VSRRQLLALLALAAIWGSSFMFIKVAARSFSPLTLVWCRMVLGVLTLAPVVLLGVGSEQIRASISRAPRPLLVVCLAQSVIGPAAVTWAAHRLDSGLVAVLQAAAPLFTVLLSLGIARHDRVTGWRLVGVGVGFGGVALLVGVQPHGDLLAAAVALVGAFCGAVAAVVAGRWLGAAGTEPLVTAFATSFIAMVVLLPAVVVSHPHGIPGWKETGSVVVLGLFCTGLAYYLFFGIVARSGASYGILATYLVPAIALALGVIFLGEAVTATKGAGLVLVLVGVGLGTGTIRRRRAAVITPPGTP
jgi:drug/metabolite transporter (DMT)-like permease